MSKRGNLLPLAVLLLAALSVHGQVSISSTNCGESAGIVRLKVELLASGKIGVITLVKGLSPKQNEQAIAAAKKIKFTPALKDGVPQSKLVTIEYNFKFFDDSPELARKAQILDFPKPKFPRSKPSDNIPSVIKLRIGLLADGTVEIDEVLTNAPKKFIDAAKKAALGIRFEPAIHQCGAKVNQTRDIEYSTQDR